MSSNRISRLSAATLMSLTCAGLGACAEGPDAEEGALDSAALSTEALAPVAKADGEGNSVERIRGGDLATVRGADAHALYDAMAASKIFRAAQRGGVTYQIGRYLICAQVEAQAACQVISQQITDGDVLSVDGRRFASGASELFGALAAVEGVDPRAVYAVATEGVRCGKDARSVWCEVDGEAANTTTLSLTLEHLGDLGPDYVYEGWLITAEGPVTSGRFPMMAAMESFEFALDRELVAASSMFVLTIELAFNDDPAPSETHVVAGAFDADGIAALTIAHPAAFGDDFSEAKGAYILQTPTSGDVAEDYDQGIWFVEPGVGAALDLPTLPAGWVYEGWVVDADGPVTTGRFVDPAAADSDMGGKAAGPDAAPPFPGQDFVDPARVLVGNTVVITVEPEPDNSPAPFFFKPLVDPSAEDVGPGVTQPMTLDLSERPQGVAAILR